MEIKIALQPPDEVVWKVGYLGVANKDAEKLFEPSQRDHLRQQITDLAGHQNPRISQQQDVVPIDQFYELRDKGGVLGRISARVFFGVFDEESLLVILGCHKKENEGSTPNHIVVKMRNRLRQARLALDNLKKQRGD